MKLSNSDDETCLTAYDLLSSAWELEEGSKTIALLAQIVADADLVLVP